MTDQSPKNSIHRNILVGIHNHTRLLGKLELNDAPPNIVNLIAPTCLQLREPIDKCVLKEAVHHFVKSQPNLLCGIKRIGNKAQFKLLNELKDVFEVLPLDYDWKEICFKYSNCLLRENIEDYSPIKVFFIPCTSYNKDRSDYNGIIETKISEDCIQNDTLINHAYIIPVYCHYAGDGSNSMTIVDDILKIYSNIKNNIGPSYELMPNPPSADEMASSWFQDDKTRETYEQKFIETYLQKYQSLNYFLPYELDPIKGCVTDSLYYLTTEEVYRKFTDFCKSNNITVGATFIALAYFGFASYAFFQDKFNEDKLFVNCNVPINLRGRVPLTIPSNCVNTGICQNLIVLPLSKGTKFWSFVNSVKSELRYIMANENKFNLFDYGVMDQLKTSDVQKSLLEKYGVDHQFTVSNMRK